MSAGVWAGSLSRQRDSINPLARAAISEGVSADALADALRAVGAGVDRHLERLPDPHLDAWTVALASAVVRALTGKRWSSRSVTPWVVTQLLPRLAAVTASPMGSATAPERSGMASALSPEAVVTDVVRAADQVWRCADVRLWGELLTAASLAAQGVSHAGTAHRVVDATLLRELGVVAAWRAGHVRLRDAAHRIGATLDPAPLAAALGLPHGTDPVAVLRANAANPTVWPSRSDPVEPGSFEDPTTADRPIRRIGGFAAYGGVFVLPPRVTEGDGVCFRVESAGDWEVLVDIHGQYLRRAAPGLPSVESMDSTTPRAAGPTRVQCRGAVLLASPTTHALLYARAAS